MCGIAGYVDAKVEPGVLKAMLARIAHRGPDGEGEWRGRTGDREVALGHRRLSIIDLEGGKQPLSNEDGKSWITFNGEIYNFKQLKADLEKRGHQFQTHSDTEVLLHHVEEHGVEGIADLNGMFAFAIWDGHKDELVIARDRAGIKPLYYAELPSGGLVFGSELSVVIEHPSVTRKLSRDGVVSYFFSDYAHPPHTLIDGVKKLPPGHLLVWRPGKGVEVRPFWKLAPQRPGSSLGDEDALARELWQRLGTAVERQLLADVPVGVFLSGGIDSSAMAVLAAPRAGYRIKTFSIGFREKSFDESSYAREVARRVGSEHVEEVLDEAALLEVVDKALDGLDEPFADPSFLPTYLLSRLAAKHVKVALGGDAGDELWAGYPTYKAHRFAEVYAMAPRLVRESLVPALVKRLPVGHGYQSLDWKAKRFTLRWDDDRVRRHFRWMSNTDLEELAQIVPFSRGIVPAVLAQPTPRVDGGLGDLLAADFTTYLPGSVLTKVDRATMAHGLEARPPFLDNDFIDWSFSIPSSFKLRHNTTKHLLKKAALPHLPEDIVKRPKKGFGIPLAAWLRGPLKAEAEAALGADVLWDAGLSREAFSRFFAEHQGMRVDHSKPLWALIVLARWARRALA
jgi:asparagine synthase (glutamine-hydrolysing)